MSDQIEKGTSAVQKPLFLFRKPVIYLLLLSAALLSVGIVLVVTNKVLIASDAGTKPQTTVQPFKDNSAIVFSHNPANDVAEVPFYLHLGHIFVRTNIENTETSALVDTGTRDILWKSLNITDNSPDQWINYWSSNGKKVPGKFVAVPRLRFGGAEVKEAQTIRVYDDQSGLSTTIDGRPYYMILGNYAFRSTVLTIDYRRQMLTLHHSDYDITKLPHRPDAALLDIVPGGNDLAFAPEFLSVRGMLEGHHTTFVIDTGHVANGIVITPEFRQQLANVKSAGKLDATYNIAGNWVTEVTQPLSWSLGNLHGHIPGLVMKLRSDWQAIIGYAVLKDYRVTIDYTRMKLLLEPASQPFIKKGNFCCVQTVRRDAETSD